MDFRPSTFLRGAILADAVASGATGLLLLAGGGVLATPFGLSEMLLRVAGLICVVYAAAIAFVGTRPTMRRGIVWTIIAMNVMWSLDSLLLLVSNQVAPATLGVVFVIGQALVVLAFAEAQFFGLRRKAMRAAMAV